MVPIDPIKALAAKRASLVSYKHKLQEDCNRQIREVDSDIASIDAALEVVRKAVEPYLCKACGGSGSRRQCDAAGQMDDVPCDACKGTGIDLGAEPKTKKR